MICICMSIYIFQSWNKYSPLPSPSDGAVSKSSSTSDFASPSEVDPYVKLSSECQGVINNLVSMGFSRPRVARAVENFGCDEKEVCIKKKGFNHPHDEYRSFSPRPGSKFFSFY